MDEHGTSPVWGCSWLVAMSLHVFEAQLPTLPIPGAKIGPANLVSLFALYAWGFREALLIAVDEADRRLAGYRYPFAPAFAFGMAGGVLASSSWPRASLRRSCPGPGGRGAWRARTGCHNVEQLLVAWRCRASPKSFSTCLDLLWFAVPSGAVVGVTATELLPFAGLLVPSPGKSPPWTYSTFGILRRKARSLPGRAQSVGARPEHPFHPLCEASGTHQRAAWAMGAFLIVAGVVSASLLRGNLRRR